MTIQSKYDSTCRGCGGRIRVGELIDWTRTSGAWHRQCPVLVGDLAADSLLEEYADQRANARDQATLDWIAQRASDRLDAREDALWAEYEAQRAQEYTAAAVSRGGRDVSRDRIPGVPRLSLVELAEQCIRGSKS